MKDGLETKFYNIMNDRRSTKAAKALEVIIETLHSRLFPELEWSTENVEAARKSDGRVKSGRKVETRGN